MLDTQQQLVMDNFPNGTLFENKGKEYCLSYKSDELVDSPWGQIPRFSFSVSNPNFEDAVKSMKQNFVINGYDFNKKIWQ